MNLRGLFFEPGIGYRLISDIFPAHQQVRGMMFRASANQGGTEMAVAVYRYQKNHGQLPETSADLGFDYGG